LSVLQHLLSLQPITVPTSLPYKANIKTVDRVLSIEASAHADAIDAQYQA